MLLLSIFSLLVGMVLGQRFKVLALLPAIATMVVISLAIGMSHAEPARVLALSTIAAIVGLQVGYLTGLGIRHLLVVLRASRSRAGSFANLVRSAH